MRPFRSFLLLLIVLICFTGLSYILPWDLNLPTVENLIPEKLIGPLINGNAEKIADEDTFASDTLQPALPPAIIPADTVAADTVAVDTVAAATIAAPPDPIEVFLDSLEFSEGQVRILYYGDSQIEYDRVTSYLRRYLRKGHGGTGPGLFLPVMPVTYTRSFYVRASPNWKRYNYLSYRNGVIKHNDLGPFMAFCRYLPDGQLSSGKVRSWIRIVPSALADESESEFEFLRIFYRNTLEDVRIDIKAGSNPVMTDTLRISSKITEFVCPLLNTRNILIDFSGKTSPDIYGISIESKTGVIVDNIPQRGSAGLEFTMVDKENLRDSYSLLKPDLVIMHYGLNLATNIRNDYSYYEKGLSRQLDLLKEISPGTGLIVVGLTDMAYQDGDVIKTYPNIPRIINAQRNASARSGAIFWDARTAMGGRSSIIKWFGMNPPLAKKDYVHLTDQGADTLARLMISELFTSREPDPYIIIPPAIQIDTAALARAEDVSVMADVRGKEGYLSTLFSGILSYDPDKPFIFSTPAFWIFYLLVLAGFSLVYKRLFLRNFYLLLVSLFFYYKTGGLFLFLLIFVTIIDFTCGLLIHNSKTRFRKRVFLVLSIISNIGILAYFKYTGFFVETINDILGTDIVVKDFLGAFSNRFLGTSFNVSNIVLPVGISFFTFQSLSYTIDMYRQKLPPVRNIFDFGFYVSFFPQLVAGPIVRASEFIPQIYRAYSLSQREFSHAVFLIMKGLIKKIIISDFIAVNFIDRVFDLPTAHSGFENLMAVYGYGLQIYCDFSGYTDIAIGLALILGFRLPFNFNSPYKATNISDFWKRWHISLSRWLKDYLYIPLGGNRKGKFRNIVNLMITMLIGGLWHGADLRFIIWGGFHGLGLAVNKIKVYIFGERTRTSRVSRAFAVFLTFQFVSFCWIFFRAQDMHSAGLIFRQIFQDFLPASFGPLFAAYSGVFALMTAGYIIHFLPEKFKEYYRGLFIKIPLVFQMVLVLLAGFLLFQMRTNEVMPFIYFRF
jgi:D-alanyl-lipoteichoic acid acyltransferase DltB (MBOAT superfamily)